MNPTTVSSSEPGYMPDDRYSFHWPDFAWLIDALGGMGVVILVGLLIWAVLSLTVVSWWVAIKMLSPILKRAFGSTLFCPECGLPLNRQLDLNAYRCPVGHGTWLPYDEGDDAKDPAPKVDEGSPLEV